VTPRGGGALLTDGDGGTGGVLLRRRDEEEAPPRPSFWRRLAIGKATPIGKIDPPGAEPASAAEPAAEPAAKIERSVDAEPPAEAEPTVKAGSPVEAEPSAEAEPTADAGPPAGAGAGAGAGADAEHGPEGEAGPSVDPGSPAEAVSGPEADAERGPDVEPGPTAGAGSLSEAVSGPEAAAERGPDAEPVGAEPVGAEPVVGAEPPSKAGSAQGAESTVEAARADSADVPERPAATEPAADADRSGAEGVRVVDARPAPSGMPRPPDLSIWPDPSRVYVTLLPEPPAIRVAPSGVGGALLARLWECGGFDCPGFGPGRRIGQPVPHMRKGVPYCPRHGERLRDAGARPAEIAVSLLVDGLRRRRFVVHENRPLVVGREPGRDDDIAVGAWLHEAATAWISPEHLRLSVDGGQLVATDLSPNGSLVWMRTEPQARPQTRRLTNGETYTLGEWDTVELYTGIELGHAERRPRGVDASADEPASVLVDAPTVAMLRLPERR
jgi:hypothetical protein